MAETLVFIILEQLTSIARKELKLVADVDDDIRKLTINFWSIRAALEDAESRQFKDSAVRDWLDKLKETSYDIDDVLDEWNTSIEKLQLKDIENASKPMIKKVCSLISCYSFSFGQIVMRRDIALNIKDLNKKLDAIATEKDMFDFSLTECIIDIRRPMITSFIDVPMVYGREEDKEKLLNKLLNESSLEPANTIISIIGIEGIGKTTLARLAFNDNKVKAHFDERIWVCVSKPFNEIMIAKAILKSLVEDASKWAIDLLDVMQKISLYLHRKKFFLVLDDVGTEDSKNWEQLIDCLKCGSQGSRILITTHNEYVSKTMGATNMVILGTLPINESWLLFRQIAFSGKASEKLEDVGRKIVAKCKGLPLAIKILGSLLHFKTNIGEWQSVLDSKMWEIEEVEREIFPPLLLSYYDLPPTLKKCFSYCAIFPKDHEIEKYELIKLWMAQGYLEEEGNKEMELVGEEYFENLVTFSLFQDFERSEYDGSIIRCKMHNIVHDFVQFLSKNECLTIPQLEISYEIVRHLYIRNSSVPYSILNLKNLRSFVVESEYFDFGNMSRYFGQLTCLRTLNLCQYDFAIPKGIKYLVHLRYLKLKDNFAITKLPEVLCDLYNLQTLDVTGCWRIRKLPQGIGKLVNLRHLLLTGTDSLWYIPKGVERLSCLKTLNKLVLSADDYGKKACTSLDSLKNLKHGPSLELGLGNVRDSNALKLANFLSTKNLLHLNLSFYIQMALENVMFIEALQPPPNLEKLRIDYFGGKSMSFNWMVSLTKLRELKLYYCYNCEHLPPLGKLPSLESLIIDRMPRIKRVGNEFLGIENYVTSSSSSSIVAFPKLKFLHFWSLRKWEEWNHEITNRRKKDIAIMPCLHSLSIRGCEELKALPDQILQTPTLQQLEIYECFILEERYKERGDYRSKISHIPKISIC